MLYTRIHVKENRRMSTCNWSDLQTLGISTDYAQKPPRSLVRKLKVCLLEFLIDLVLNAVCVIFIGHRAGCYFAAIFSNTNPGWGDQLHEWEARASPGGVHQMWEGLCIVTRNARFYCWELRPLYGGRGDGDFRSQPIFRASGRPEPHHVTIGWQTCQKIIRCQ